MSAVDDYIASKPEPVQERLEELRQIIRDSLPNTTEELKWGSPAIIHESGMILAIYAAYKQHCNVVVTPSAMDSMREKFVDFETGKGSLKIPHDREVPKELLEELVTTRLREYETDGVTWM